MLVSTSISNHIHLTEGFQFFLDDKARVPIGLTAANKQSPLMIHVEYRVQLSDHDFVLAKSHKLVPSVIAAVEVKQNCIGQQVGMTYYKIQFRALGQEGFRYTGPQ